MSGASLISSIEAWVAENPSQAQERARIGRLEVPDVLRQSELADNDLSDSGLTAAALLFPRHDQVALFRFFCDVRTWWLQQPQRASAIRTSAPDHVIEPGDAATPLHLDALDDPDATAPQAAVAERPIERELVGAAAPAARVTTPARIAQSTATRLRPPTARPTPPPVGPSAITHPRLRCPHSADELAAMPAKRAAVAALEFDVWIDASWPEILQIATSAGKLIGDPMWSIDQASPSEAHLWFHTSASASPSVHATLARRDTANGPVVRFRVVKVRMSLLSTLVGRRDPVRPARVLGRKIAWGLLPSDPVTQR